MICPMLSQSQRDDEGNVAWDHHECIESACTFWSGELSDCGIRASGLVTITRARSVLAGGAGQEPEPHDEGTEPLLEALVKREPSALEPVLSAVESSNSNLRDTGLKLLEGVAALEQPIKSIESEVGKQVLGLKEELGSLADTVAGRLSDMDRRLDDLGRLEESVAALGERLAPADSVREIGTRIEELASTVRGMADAMTERFSQVGERLDRVQGLEAGLTRLEASVSYFSEDTGTRFSSLREGLEEVGRTVRECSAAKPEYVNDMEETLSGLGGRFTSLSDRLDALATHMTELRGSQERIAEDLTRASEQREKDQSLRRKEEACDLNTRGVALFHRGAHEAAESAFRSALSLHPDFPEALNNLGLALGKQGKSAEAEECFRKALETDPGLTEAMNNLGFLFHKGMEFEKAVDMFRQSALSSEDSSLAYTNLGSACYKLGKYAEAVDAWKKAVDRNPLNENALRALKMFEQSPPDHN